jgi:metal-responsive CopG/Arc/MetJ family transcriptional regulator
MSFYRKEKYMKVVRTTNMELDMVREIEEYMKIHGISFAEFIRRAADMYINDHQDTQPMMPDMQSVVSLFNSERRTR